MGYNRCYIHFPAESGYACFRHLDYNYFYNLTRWHWDRHLLRNFSNPKIKMTLAPNRAQIMSLSTSHQRLRLCTISLWSGHESKASKSKHHRSELRCSMWRKTCSRTNLWSNCAKMLIENLALSCLIRGLSVARATLHWHTQSISCTVTSCLTSQGVRAASGGTLVSKLKRWLGHHNLPQKGTYQILIWGWVP